MLPASADDTARNIAATAERMANEMDRILLDCRCGIPLLLSVPGADSARSVS